MSPCMMRANAAFESAGDKRRADATAVPSSGGQYTAHDPAFAGVIGTVAQLPRRAAADADARRRAAPPREVQGPARFASRHGSRRQIAQGCTTSGMTRRVSRSTPTGRRSEARTSRTRLFEIAFFLRIAFIACGAGHDEQLARDREP